jgi:uncharacterized RDD family membrane protein YckC
MSEIRSAVLIASGRFPEEQALEDLRCPERDVDALNEVLASPARGGFSQTHVLKNVPSHEVLLRINRALREAGKEDLILIYYSGHGKLNAAGKLHLATVDTVVNALEATSIPVGTIRDYIDISAAHRIVLVLDCCFGGAAGPAFVRGDVGDQLQLIGSGRGTYIMTASTGIQVAVEKESDEYGVFTKHLVQGISTGQADLGGDGLIGMDELYTYVHDKVLEEGFQEPMKWDLNVRGELIIARSGRTPREDRIKEIRRRLGYLARRQLLPDRILSQAYDVLRLEPDELIGESELYYSLLEELVQEKMTLGEFIGKWYHSGPPAAARPVDLPAEPAETATDEEAKVAEPLPTMPPATEPPREEAATEVKAPATPEESRAIPDLTTMPLAGFWRRSFAFAIDLLCASAISLAIFNLARFVTTGEQVGSQLLALLAWLGYFLLANTRGQLIGKAMLGIKVIDPATGRGPGFAKGALRTAGLFLTHVTFDLGFLIMIGDRRKMALHDHLARTIVIRTRQALPRAAESR